MNAQTKASSNQLAALWRALTEPSAAVSGSEPRRQARLLTKLALSLGMLATVINLVNASINPNPDRTITVVFTIGIFALTAGVYLLAHTRLYLHGAALALVVYTAGILLQFALIGAPVINLLYYLFVPLALCLLVFSRRLGLVLLAVIILGAALVAGLRGIPFFALSSNPLGFLFFMTVMLYAVRRYLDDRESEGRAQLAEREYNYRLLTRLVTDYAYSLKYVDGAWSLDWVSNDSLALAGYSRDELAAGGWELIVHPDDWPVIVARLAQLRAGEPTVTEFRIRNRQGDTFWVHDHAYPLRDSAGALTRMIGASTDITARKNAEQAEREQRLLAEALSDAAASIAHSLDIDEVLDRILTSMGRVVPYDAASIMLIEGDTAVIARHQGFDYPDQETFEQLYRFPVQATRSLREVYERGSAVLIPDTSAYPDWVDRPVTGWIASWIGAPIRSGDSVIGFLNVDSRVPGHFTAQHAARLQVFADQCSTAIRNAQLYRTVRQQAADLELRVAARTAELEQERRELAAILDSMGEGMCYTEGGCIRYANRALLEMTGFALAELIAMPLSALAADAGQADAADVDAALHAGRVWRSELLLRTNGDTLLETGITVAPLSADGAAVPGAVAILRDISLEKRLQRQKNRFISTASHELRTPITNLNTRMYLVRRDPSRMAEHLAIIGEVVDRMRDLSDDLLNLAQLERGAIVLNCQTLPLQDLAAAVARVQQAEAELKGVTLALRLAPDEPLLVHVDAGRITQVLTNLVVNAINYTPLNGQVVIETARLDGQHAAVRVTDTGVGIAPEHLTQVFEPFFRIQGEAIQGTGLGLSIAYEVVQLHGGEITVTSEPGRGSSFTVRLPLADVG